MNFILIYQHIKSISCGKYIQIFKCVFKLNDVCKHHTTQLSTHTHRLIHKMKRERKNTLTHTRIHSRSTCTFSVLHWTIHRYFTTVSSSVCMCGCECIQEIGNGDELHWRPPDECYVEVEVEIDGMRAWSVCDLCAYYKMITLLHQMFIELNQLWMCRFYRTYGIRLSTHSHTQRRICTPG